MTNRYISKILIITFLLLVMITFVNSTTNETNQTVASNEFNISYNTTYNNTDLNTSEKIINNTTSERIDESIQKEKDSMHIIIIDKTIDKITLGYQDIKVTKPIFKIINRRIIYLSGGEIKIPTSFIENNTIIELYDSTTRISSIKFDEIELSKKYEQKDENNITKTLIEENKTEYEDETENITTIPKTSKSRKIYINKTSQIYHVNNKNTLDVNFNSLAEEILGNIPEEIIHVSSKIINMQGKETTIKEQRTTTGVNITFTENMNAGSYSLISSIFYNNKSHIHSIPLLVDAIKLKNNTLKIFNKKYNSSIASLRSSSGEKITVEETIINLTTTKIKLIGGIITQLRINTKDITTLENDYIGLDTNISNNTGIKNTTWIQSYAIDPSQSNITTIDITATAKGNKLYKCVDWNFTTQTCYGEWTYLRSIVPGENYTITVDIIDPAFGEISDFLQMEWGVINAVNDTWQTINLVNTYQRPVIVASPHYTTSGVPTVTRIKNISQTSFEIRLQDTGGGIATTRNINYVVVEEGAWQLSDGTNIEAFSYISTQTDSDSDWTPVQQTPTHSYTDPVILGQVMSYNDTAWSVFWASDGTQAGNPTAANIYTGKHVGQDPTTSRNNEEIGVIIMEDSEGTIAGVEYDSYVSSDSVRGVGNTPPFTVNNDKTFSSAPNIGIVATAGMDGGNGGWPARYGTSTTTSIDLTYDEYDSGERAHTPEPVAIFVFEKAGNYSGNTAPIFATPKFNESIVEPFVEVYFNVNVTDEQDNFSIEYVQATFSYPNNTLFDANLTQKTIGAATETGDIETGIQTAKGSSLSRMGETGIAINVNSWQTITMSKTYTDPAVFVFNLDQATGTDDAEQAMAIVTNITTTEFRVSVINASNNFITDNVSYVILEKGIWNISNTEVQVGDWNYSGTTFTTKNFSQTFANTPTVYFQIQNNTNNWYAGRYIDTSLGTNSIDIQYEDGFDLFPETVSVSYIAFPQGTTNDFFAGNIETGVADDGNSGTWRTINFPQTYTTPAIMGIISESGTDPAKLGINSLTTTSVGVRPIEETASDSEQAHASNDILWMVFNTSTMLEDEIADLTDNSLTPINYSNVESSNLDYISSITVTVTIDEYNSSASDANNNNAPTLNIELGTETGYQTIGTISGVGNKSKTGNLQSITTAWAKNSTLRDIQITPTNIDHLNSTTSDSISWSNVYVNIQAGNRTIEWSYLFTNTKSIGTYNLTALETTDGILENKTNYSSISFEVKDQTPPTITKIYNITIGDTQALNADFDATDNSGISTWKVNDTTQFNINSIGTLTNMTTLAINVYYLNISVNDTYNNNAWDIITINVTNTPDVTAPIFKPNLTTIERAYGIIWNYDINATDDRGIIREYWINDTINFAINSETGVLTNNTILNLGIYSINVNVNDSSNNINTSRLFINITDQTPPQFNIPTIFIEYGIELAQQLIITDDVLINTISINNNNFSINNSGYIINTTPLSRGTYNITITANDSTNNENSTEVIIIVQDTIAPNSITELNAQSREYTWIYWNWTAPSNIDLSHYSIYLDEIFHSNITTTNINITGLNLNTNYTLRVETSDYNNNINTTNISNKNNTIYNNKPNIIINSPLNLTASLDKYRVLNVTVNDIEEETLCVSITASQSSPISNEHIIYTNCNYNNNTEINYNWSKPVLENISSTEVLWHFDNNSNYDESDTSVHDFGGGIAHTITCSGLTCPTAIANGAIGGAFNYNDINSQGWYLTEQFFNDAFTTRSYQLWFKADDTTGTKYLFEEGGGTNGLGFKIESNTLQAAVRTSSTQFTTSTPFTDTTNWHFLVVQYNNGNLSMYLDGSLVDSIDTSGSYTSISAHSDEGYIGASTGSGAFGTDSGYFDGQIDEFRITTTTLSESEILNLSAFAINTTYYWNIIADDKYDTVNKEVQFLVEAPTADMNILTVNYSKIIEGRNGTIFAYINNSGTTSETNILVEFIINNTISINKTISSIDPGEIKIVNISYLFKLGKTTLNVTVDANNKIIETDETNNKQDSIIEVSSWHTFYGSLDLETVIEDNNSNNLFTWFKPSATGIIYFTDSDASINFANIYALGQNSSLENSTNDFVEIDTALGLTGRTDSINNLYGLTTSVAKEIRNFTINKQLIENVPVINSTNSSTFQTGILWDATSDTTGEYDENETLIFIANVESNLQGMYDIYDYEITIPSTLQTSEGASNSLNVYIELK